MADDWKAQMQERFDKLEAKVDNLGTKVDDLDKKVDGLAKKVDGLDKKVGSLDRRVERLETKVDGLDKKIDTVEDRLSNNFKIAVEEMKDTVKKMGEGFQAGLETIHREMKEMNRNWESKWGLHDRVLRNHSGRLTKLESRKA